MGRPYKKRPSDIVSYTMSRIRSKGTGIELAMEKTLKRAGISYKKHSSIFGKPDFIVPPAKLAIFCDSDFWHGHKWKRRKAKLRSNRNYWIPKIEGNMLRDKKVDAKLRRNGWSVMRFWGHEIEKDLDGCLKRITLRLKRLKRN